MSDASALTKLALVVLGTLGTSLVVGCAAPASEEASAEMTESALDEAATLRFDGAWNETVTGSLQRGKKVRVVYDADRLTQCRGELNGGGPAWSITGYWQINGGPVHSFNAGGLSPTGAPAEPFTLDATGDLQLWFQNVNRWGCNAYDSNLGANYHFTVGGAVSDPGWVGNVRYAIDRMTCDGICESSLKPINGDVIYDTWARQRAAIRAVTFEVWKEGVTDFDNGDLWRQLDVQVHSRVGSSGAFATTYVPLDKRVGNNARYAVDLRALDPIPGMFTIQNASDCPAFDLTVAPGTNGANVQATVEMYMTVNGVEVRPAGPSSVFRVRYMNYTDLFTPCVH